jgi:glutamyl-tRNA synthetase
MFHVGSARAALHNWIVAQQAGGTFVLRIEDTDAARNRPEWIEGILSAMDWIGIERGTYEGPYLQSAYVAEHAAAATRLYGEARAYYCDCTRD